MSAIAAARLSRAGDPGAVLKAVIADMPYRTPDGTAFWASESVGLGAGLMRTLPEECNRASVSSTGTVHLVSDVRLDNRETLLSELKVSDTGTSDAKLLLAAYVKWGTKCTDHLLGDFAFALFDRDKDLMFAARDHMGAKPLFYRFDKAGLLIASEVRPLKSPGPPFTPVQAKDAKVDQIADFMANRRNHSHTMFYEGLYRLPGGHSLTSYGAEAPNVRPYWQARAVPPHPLDQSPAAFRRILTSAVTSRMRTSVPLASLLSGGLDSTSISCIAGDVGSRAGNPPIETFSIVFDETPDLSEREFIDAAVALKTFKPYYVPLDGYAPLEGLADLQALNGRLLPAPGLTMTQKLIETVAKAGYRVILDGHGGDEAISHGFGRLAELAQRGRWLSLWSQLRAFCALYGDNRLQTFVLYVLRFSRAKGVHTLRRMWSRWQGKSRRSSKEDCLGPKLKAAESESKRITKVDKAKSEPTEAGQHLQILQSVPVVESIEILELLGAYNGLEARFPFFDKRVVEFCLALPSEAKLDKGWSRLILREAMDGLLPSKVQWRRSKFDFTPHLAIGLLKHHTATIRSVLADEEGILQGYVDLEVIRRLFQHVEREGYRARGEDVQTVWRTIALSLWLGQTKRASEA